MSRIKPLVAPALKVSMLFVAIAVAIEPLSLKERAEATVFAAWIAVGDHLAKRELAAIAQQLDLARQDAEKLEHSKDSIATRLIVLEAQRELLSAEIHERGSSSGDGFARDLAVVDRAIAVLKSTAGRAESVLRSVEHELRARRIELSVLNADDEARRMNRALARPIGDPAKWSSHVARARIILGPLSPDHADPRTTSEKVCYSD
jgi:hypothetical protein